MLKLINLIYPCQFTGRFTFTDRCRQWQLSQIKRGGEYNEENGKYTLEMIIKT